MMKRTAFRRAALAALACSTLCACSDRDEVWNTNPGGPPEARAMRSAVAIIDASANRALMLPVVGDLELDPTSLTIGQRYAASEVSSDGDKLLVLSHGDVPKRTVEDEAPSLTVIDAADTPRVAQRFELSDPLSGLAIDPESHFAVAFASERDKAFVQNPNELVIVDLDRGAATDNPVELTLRSFGGRPQRITFTPELGIPGGARRLLVVETERDVSLVDLANLDIPEVTIQLTAGADPLVPAGVAIHDGDPERDDDTRLAIRIEDDPNVIIVDLLPVAADMADETPQSYRAAPNVVFVGGTPSDVAFVRTDGGLRIAALVPSKGLLTLVDPSTGIASEIELGAPFEQLSLVTSVVAEGDDTDVALLWSTSKPDIAFVALGSTVGKPYRSVERLELTEPVANVRDVPAPNAHLKILGASSGSSLVVLDLLQRTASPITSTRSSTALVVAPNGLRAWLSATGLDLAQLDLASLHPNNLMLHKQIDSLFDIERRDGGRALIALHARGAFGATVLDADAPSLERAREYDGLLLGDLR